MELEKGQQILKQDLEELLEEVKNGEFGDLSNDKYSAPKTELIEKFRQLSKNVIEGKYD